MSDSKKSNQTPSEIIIVEVDHRYRVVERRGQWVLQKRAGTRHGRVRWDNVRYFRSKKPLIDAVRALRAEQDHKNDAVLDNLPERIGNQSEYGKRRDPRYPARKQRIPTQGKNCPKCGGKASKGSDGRPNCVRCGRPLKTERNEYE